MTREISPGLLAFFVNPPSHILTIFIHFVPRTVHGLEPTCEICKATFTNQSEWIHHMKTEHPEEYSAKLQDLEKDSTCDICLKEFANAMLLKKHKNGVHFKSHQELYQHKNKNKVL